MSNCSKCHHLLHVRTCQCCLITDGNTFYYTHIFCRLKPGTASSQTLGLLLLQHSTLQHLFLPLAVPLSSSLSPGTGVMAHHCKAGSGLYLGITANYPRSRTLEPDGMWQSLSGVLWVGPYYLGFKGKLILHLSITVNWLSFPKWLTAIMQNYWLFVIKTLLPKIFTEF